VLNGRHIRAASGRLDHFGTARINPATLIFVNGEAGRPTEGRICSRLLGRLDSNQNRDFVTK